MPIPQFQKRLYTALYCSLVLWFRDDKNTRAVPLLNQRVIGSVSRPARTGLDLLNLLLPRFVHSQVVVDDEDKNGGNSRNKNHPLAS